MLGADVVVPKRHRLLLGQDDHLPGLFGEALEHGAMIAAVGGPRPARGERTGLKFAQTNPATPGPLGCPTVRRR